MIRLLPNALHIKSNAKGGITGGRSFKELPSPKPQTRIICQYVKPNRSGYNHATPVAAGARCHDLRNLAKRMKMNRKSSFRSFSCLARSGKKGQTQCW